MENKVDFGKISAQRVRVSQIRPLQAVLARCRRQLFDFEWDALVASGVELSELVCDEDDGDEKWE